jgi:hypothetical protein
MVEAGSASAVASGGSLKGFLITSTSPVIIHSRAFSGLRGLKVIRSFDSHSRFRSFQTSSASTLVERFDSFALLVAVFTRCKDRRCVR